MTPSFESFESAEKIVVAMNQAYADGDYIAALNLFDDRAMVNIARARGPIDLKRLAVPGWKSVNNRDLILSLSLEPYVAVFMQELATHGALALDLSGDLEVIDILPEVSKDDVALIDVLTSVSTVEGTTTFRVSASQRGWGIRSVRQNDAESNDGFPLVPDPDVAIDVALPAKDREPFVYQPVATSRYGLLDLASPDGAAMSFAELMREIDYVSGYGLLTSRARLQFFQELNSFQADRLVRPGIEFADQVGIAATVGSNSRIFDRFLSAYEPAQHHINFSGDLTVTDVVDGETSAGKPAKLVSATLSSEPGELVFVVVDGVLDRWYIDEVRVNGGTATRWFFNVAYWLEGDKKRCPDGELVELDAPCGEREPGATFGIMRTPERAIAKWLDTAIDNPALNNVSGDNAAIDSVSGDTVSGDNASIDYLSIDYVGACDPDADFDENQWCSRGSTDTPGPDGRLFRYTLSKVGDEQELVEVLLNERGLNRWRVVGSQTSGALRSDKNGTTYDVSKNEQPAGLYLSILDYFLAPDSPYPSVEGWCHEMGVAERGKVFKTGRCIRPHTNFPDYPYGTYRVIVRPKGEKRREVTFRQNGDFWEIDS